MHARSGSRVMGYKHTNHPCDTAENPTSNCFQQVILLPDDPSLPIIPPKQTSRTQRRPHSSTQTDTVHAFIPTAASRPSDQTTKDIEELTPEMNPYVSAAPTTMTSHAAVVSNPYPQTAPQQAVSNQHDSIMYTTTVGIHSSTSMLFSTVTSLLLKVSSNVASNIAAKYVPC